MLKRIKTQSWNFLLLELLVVFIGVYGAFYFDNLREERKTRENQIKYYSTFLMNLEYLGQQTKELYEFTGSEIDRLSDPSEEIKVLRQMDFTHNQLIIKAGFESSNFSVISPNFLSSLSGGSDLMKQIERRTDHLEKRTQEYIYGQIADAENFRKWYINELGMINSLSQALIGAINNGAIPATRQYLDNLSNN